MEIRHTREEDLDEIMLIYEEARRFMRESGNPKQWAEGGYPQRELIMKDIERGISYVCEDGGQILATFMYLEGEEPTYAYIEDGEWPNDNDYAVIHRIAVRRGTVGTGAYCLDWAYNKYGQIRIDTHDDNAPMRRLLEKLGFTYAGNIYLENGDRRRAYYKIKSMRF